MLDRLNKRARDLYSRLIKKNRETALDNLCCLSIAPREISLAYITQKKNKPELVLCDVFPYQENNLEEALTRYVKRKDLEGVPCSLMLRPEDYQLLSMEALPVPPEEFQAAIRWAVKDLIHASTEGSVIDSFPLVAPKLANAKAMMMVVVAQLAYLQKISAAIRESGLDLRIIDIPEMALRNIASLYEREGKGIGFIYIQNKIANFLVIRDKKLCFTRQVHGNSDSSDNELILDEMALEVQRSLDYYESQWRQGRPSEIIFATVSSESVSGLSARLGISVRQFNIADSILPQQKIDFALQNQCLFVLGGALREEGGDDAAAN